MLKHFLKRFWKLLIAIGVVGGALQVGLNIFPKIYYFFLSCIYKISLLLKISSVLTLTLFGLLVLCLLTVTLSLLCIFKKEKIISINAEPPTNYEPLPIIEDDPTETLKLSKEETETLLLYKGDKKLFESELLELSPFSTYKTKLYFKNLYNNGFIKEFSETERQYLTINMVGGYRYALTQKGREYLHDNNLLD